MILNLNTKEKLFLLDALKEKADSKEKDALIRKIERSLKPIAKKSAKAKGHEWQKEICEMISRITKIPFDQSSDESQIRSHEGSLNGADIVLTGAAKAKFPYCVECKNAAAISLPEWVRQAESNADRGDNWLLFIKSPQFSMKKIAVLPLSLFERLFTQS